MQIYQPNQKGPLKINGFIDPDDVTNITVFWGCPQFLSDTVYRQNDIVSPSIDNGYYYKCTINGVSGPTEPVWTQDEILSGSAFFVAVPWDLWLLPGETIFDSLWFSDITIPLTDTFDDLKSSVLVGPINSNAIAFELTNQITKSTGEKLSRSFLYKINEQ